MVLSFYINTDHSCFSLVVDGVGVESSGKVPLMLPPQWEGAFVLLILQHSALSSVEFILKIGSIYRFYGV